MLKSFNRENSQLGSDWYASSGSSISSTASASSTSSYFYLPFYLVPFCVGAFLENCVYGSSKSSS